MPFDNFVFDLIHGFSGQAKVFDWLGIFLAKYVPYILVVCFLIFIWRVGRNIRGRFYYLLFSGLVFLLSRGLITEVLRIVFPRPRPFLEIGFSPLISPSSSMSFPSGHAVVFFAIASV